MINTLELEKKAAMDAAAKIAAAVRTAPKGCGVDDVEVLVLEGKDKDALTREMRQITIEGEADYFTRDAGCVDDSYCIVLVGVHNNPLGLTSCGYCGFKDCAEMQAAGGHCSFKTVDLGIAIGSAVSIAADNRIDNRVLFSAGVAARRLKLFPDDVIDSFGIPLAVKGKSPFYDRIEQAEG